MSSTENYLWTLGASQPRFFPVMKSLIHRESHLEVGGIVLVDNSLSPHGGVLVDRVASPEEAARMIKGLPRLAVREQIARECVNIAYGFFSPLEGFMGQADVDSVVRNMTLASGYVWSIPIVMDVSNDELTSLGVGVGDSVLLTNQEQPLAVLEVDEIFSYDKELMAGHGYGTNDLAHPGVMRTNSLEDTFVSGPITLVNPPVINPPFDEFWKTPAR